MDNVKATRVLLTVLDDTDATQIATSSHHNLVSDIKLNKLLNTASGEVHLNSVVSGDGGVTVADGATIVGDDGGNTLGSDDVLPHLAKLELSLLRLDGGGGEATLNIVHEAEVLVGLLNGDNIHETGGEVQVGADFAIDLDQTLHADQAGLLASESILQTVSQQNDERQALTQFVGTGRRMRCLITMVKSEKQPNQK